MKASQRGEVRSEVQKQSVSLQLSVVCCASEWTAEGMPWRLSAYWQASDTDTNCRSNLATSLFTTGIKLKNTASNFIPGFPLHHSQGDIYSLARCPFSHPLPLTPPHSPSLSLSRALLTDNKLSCKQGWLRAENDASVTQNGNMGLTMKSFPFPHTWTLNYYSTARDNSLFCLIFHRLHHQLDLH